MNKNIKGTNNVGFYVKHIMTASCLLKFNNNEAIRHQLERRYAV